MKSMEKHEKPEIRCNDASDVFSFAPQEEKNLAAHLIGLHSD